MKTKRMITGLLAASLCLSMLTACGSSGQQQSDTSNTTSQTEQKSDTSTSSTEPNVSGSENSADKEPDSQNNQTTHTLYVRDAGKSAEITATFFNTMNDQTESVKMTKTSETDDYFIYSCEGDVSAYNMVYLDYGAGRPSMKAAFNNFVSGWYLSNDELLPYVVGQEPDYTPEYETKVLQFDGYDKNVYIWTPDDYDKNSDEKYSVIYMLDGQTVLSKEINNEIQCWNVAEHTESMMAVTDNKALIVAVETMGKTDENGKVIASRDDELIPDIGELIEWEGQKMDSKKRGTAFSDFVYSTVVPYIEENYNVYTDAAHNAVAGSSLGGLESFYIGMEHPDKFGTVGAFSASFQVYDEDVWENYAESKTFDENLPFIYFYAGSYSGDTGFCDEPVYNAMIEKGYPKDKLVFNKDEEGEHFVPYWRNVYPEFLEAMFTQKVSALESGVPVEYKNTANTNQTSTTEPVSIDENDTRPAEILNYFYFDNSETKWDKVYAYWWGGNPVNKVTGEDNYGNPEWPGLEMEKMDDTDIYRVVVPLGNLGLVFSSGVTDEEVEKGTVAYQTNDLQYSSSVHAGQIYKIDISKDPVPGRGIEKTKFKYSAGTWSDYIPQ